MFVRSFAGTPGRPISCRSVVPVKPVNVRKSSTAADNEVKINLLENENKGINHG